MKDIGGRWLNRVRVTGEDLGGTSLAEAPAGGATASPAGVGAELTRRIGTTTFAFRGYDQANLGRSLELLDHPAYGPVVRAALDEASAVASETLKRRVDLAEYVRAGGESTLETFPQDVALIVAMELAQVRLLEEFFGVPTRRAGKCFGYSIGELTAVVFAGLFTLEQLLPVPLAMAEDCAALAADVTMGVLFTRGPDLPVEVVERLCVAISSEGRGLIGPSAFLGPNAALLLGQGDTIDRFERAMRDQLPKKSMLRRNPNKWPPLHTPLVWQCNVPNRTAVAVYKLEGAQHEPKPPVLSCVTGAASYDALSARELLVRWTDQPQRLWDVIYETLATGSDRVIHVGPAPNLIPATYGRLSNNVRKHLNGACLSLLGRGVVSGMTRHAWLARLIPSKAALLRAPFVDHLILEDWLLAQTIP